MSADEAIGLMAWGIPGGPEWLVLLVLGLLIFGKRLPDIARSIGKSIVEFKKGVRDVETDIETSSRGDQQDRTLPHSKDNARRLSDTRDAAGVHGADKADSADAAPQATKTRDSDIGSG